MINESSKFPIITVNLQSWIYINIKYFILLHFIIAKLLYVNLKIEC